MSGADRKLRGYLDTSVFGGVYDAGFDEASRAIVARVAEGRMVAMVGATTLAELSLAPERVQDVFHSLPRTSVFLCPITRAVEALRDEYLAARVLGEASLDDATHVATATVHDADVVVSWNFKHIVNLGRIRGFNSVNVGLGYKAMTIISPLELLYAE
ncbi:MAG: PIN domain protein [Phycisphaerales bacterium]